MQTIALYDLAIDPRRFDWMCASIIARQDGEFDELASLRHQREGYSLSDFDLGGRCPITKYYYCRSAALDADHPHGFLLNHREWLSVTWTSSELDLPQTLSAAIRTPFSKFLEEKVASEDLLFDWSIRIWDIAEQRGRSGWSHPSVRVTAPALDSIDPLPRTSELEPEQIMICARDADLAEKFLNPSLVLDEEDIARHLDWVRTLGH